MPLVLHPSAVRAGLPTRLTDLGWRRKLAELTAGGGRFLAVLFAAVAVACVLDAAYHLPAVVRGVWLVLTLAAGGVLFVRGVLRPARPPVSARAVAHRLEAAFPKLNDSLASAVEFLTAENADRYGSARFRRIAVVRATNALNRCQPDLIVPSRRAWRWAGAAALVVVVTGVLAVLNPAHAGPSAVRLFDPFGGHDWPTKTRIEITDPAAFPVRMATGDPFDLAFTLRGVMPETATVSVLSESGNGFEEVLAVSPAEGAKDRADVAVRLDPHRIPKSFRLKVRANDAETAWLPVNLAPPPRLVPLNGRQSPQLHATYPAYTDLPPADLPDGAAVVEAVAGTRLRLAAATDRRVVSAWLIPQADRAAARTAAGVAPLAGLGNPFAAAGAGWFADAVLDDIPVSVGGPDGTHLTADFIPTATGLYALRFTDDTGLSGSRLLDLRISPDPAPNVTLDRPAVGQDPLVLLPTATLNVVAHAEDRTFAVRRLAVEYRVGSAESPVREWALVDLPAVGLPLSAVAAPAAGFTRMRQPSVAVAAVVPLSTFTKPDGTPPADGDLVILRAAATDFDDWSVNKEPGRSKEEVVIRVVGRAGLETVLQDELSKLRPQLLKLREEQRQARERTDEVAKAAADDKLKPDDAGKLGQAERDQRGIRTAVGDPRDGLRQAAKQLKDTVAANGLPRSATTDRVEAVADDLARLAEQHLDPADPLIASAKQEADKAATGGKSDPKAVAADLKKAVRQQQSAEVALDATLKRLEQWGGAGEVRAEAKAIKDQLNKAGVEAAKAGEKVDAGKPADQLTPAEKAELARTADKLTQLADRAAGTLGKAERVADEKEAKAKQLQQDADAKAADAKAARDAAGQQPSGSAGAKDAQAKADALQQQANDAKADAAKAKAEADALRAAVKAAGGQELPNDLRSAASTLQQNNTSQSAADRQAAADKLDKLAKSLGETQPELGDQLAKKKDLADDVEKLANEQDELQKKVKKAEMEPDAAKRMEELSKLAREQERLKEQTEQLAERLVREREQDAAEQLRKAAEKMDAAKADLDQGKPPAAEQKDALEKLDDTVKKLDEQRQEDKDKLSTEKRAQLADQVKALRERLKATDDEAARIQVDVLKQAGWDRAKLASLGDLEDRAKAVAEELRKFAAAELEPLPVFRQLTEQAAALTDTAGKRFAERKNDALDAAGQAFDPKAEEAADDRTRRPLRTALRRVDYVLASLKDDPKDKKPDAAKEPPAGGDMPPPGGMPPGSAPDQSGVPPLAQLKALRAIQAELNDRTAEFAKAHPDAAKLTDTDREDLDELERSQREVADLFEKIAPLFKKMTPEPALP